MLWSFEPVKYCQAAPNDSDGTTRRSTWSPSEVRIVSFVGPRRTMDAPGIAANRSRTFSGSEEVTRMSRSPTVSRRRRRLPATSIWWTGARCGCG